MNQSILRMWVPVCLSVVFGATASRADSVFVESVASYVNASGSVGVYLQNDAALKGITIPFVIRAGANGCYPVALSGEFTPGSRPEPFLNDIVAVYQFDNEDGSCKEDQPGGFGTISPLGPSDPDGACCKSGDALIRAYVGVESRRNAATLVKSVPQWSSRNHGTYAL